MNFLPGKRKSRLNLTFLSARIDVYNTKFVAENPDIGEIKLQQEKIQTDQMQLNPQPLPQQSTMVQ